MSISDEATKLGADLPNSANLFPVLRTFTFLTAPFIETYYTLPPQKTPSGSIYGFSHLRIAHSSAAVV
jgi:hypothetical protein